MKFLRSFSIFLLAGLISGCAGMLASGFPTPLPTEYLPTVIALTLQAGESNQPSSGLSLAAIEPGTPQPESVVDTQIPASTATPTPELQTPTPYPITLPPPPTETPLPDIPAAFVQIYKPGDLSRVVSPLHVSSYLKTRDVGLVRVELYGEDGRLLVRQDKKFLANSASWSNLSLDLDFEISATAEVGRLVISADDKFGRTMALNSVDLILMSVGEADINPSSAVDEAIIIQQPGVKALIQGGQVLISGLARPDTDRPMMAELRDEKNKIVGFRQLGVSDLVEDGYGTFAVEVPYKVDALTPVRLSVFEDSENTSAMTHLSSIEVMLSP